jgi:co-chaperonin GroES (HSP10)
MSLRPVGDRVLIKLDKKEEKIGSIYVPDSKQQANLTGTVIAIGSGKNAKLLAIGDRVIVRQMYELAKSTAELCTSAFTCDEYGDSKGEGYLMLEADQILAVIEGTRIQPDCSKTFDGTL